MLMTTARKHALRKRLYVVTSPGSYFDDGAGTVWACVTGMTAPV